MHNKKKFIFSFFCPLLIFGVFPKYLRIKNKKNKAMPFKMHVSHLQNGLPFAKERFHSIKWLANACNYFAKALHGHKPRNVKFGAPYLYW
jgi:hypothetical protein